METLVLSSVNLGNDGLSQIVKAFNYGLDNAIKAAKKVTPGEFIQEGKEHHKEKDFSILP